MRTLIQTKAKQFGTFNSPTTGTIIYVDPSHDDEQHHSPLLDAAEAGVAFERGLIEDPADAGKKEVPAADEPRDPNALGTVAAERTAEHAEADSKVSNQPSALDSRQSTAWPDAARVNGGADGFVDGVRHDDERRIEGEGGGEGEGEGEGDDDDADAAPGAGDTPPTAPKRPGRKPKAPAA